MGEVATIPTDPVKAVVGIGNAAAGIGGMAGAVNFRLWEQDDDAVGVIPTRIASILQELVTDFVVVLYAAMQRDVDFTG